MKTRASIYISGYYLLERLFSIGKPQISTLLSGVEYLDRHPTEGTLPTIEQRLIICKKVSKFKIVKYSWQKYLLSIFYTLNSGHLDITRVAERIYQFTLL